MKIRKKKNNIIKEKKEVNQKEILDILIDLLRYIKLLLDNNDFLNEFPFRVDLINNIYHINHILNINYLEEFMSIISKDLVFGEIATMNERFLKNFLGIFYSEVSSLDYQLLIKDLEFTILIMSDFKLSSTKNIIKEIVKIIPENINIMFKNLFYFYQAFYLVNQYNKAFPKHKI